MVSSLTSKFARQTKKKSDKERALEISGLMSLSRRLLAEAKEQYKQAAKAPPAEREKVQQEALNRAREAKELATQAKRLMGNK